MAGCIAGALVLIYVLALAVEFASGNVAGDSLAVFGGSALVVGLLLAIPWFAGQQWFRASAASVGVLTVLAGLYLSLVVVGVLLIPIGLTYVIAAFCPDSWSGLRILKWAAIGTVGTIALAVAVVAIVASETAP